MPPSGSAKSRAESLVARLEAARAFLRLNLSQMGLSGMKNRADYGLLLERLREGGSPRVNTFDRLLDFLVSKGFRRSWVQNGDLPEREDGQPVPPAPLRATELVPRLEFTRKIVDKLIDEGKDPTIVQAAAYQLAFHSPGGSVTEEQFEKQLRGSVASAKGKRAEGPGLTSADVAGPRKKTRKK